MVVGVRDFPLLLLPQWTPVVTGVGLTSLVPDSTSGGERGHEPNGVFPREVPELGHPCRGPLPTVGVGKEQVSGMVT